MMKKIGYVLILVLMFAGCKSKKRVVTRQPGPVVVVRQEQNPNSGVPNNGTKDADLYPMPPNPSRFIEFPIANTAEYIDTFAEIAQYEMRAYGIPASIKLAQGILESGSGRGELTQKTNNHFGIKCHTGWDGEFDFHDDDAKGECFRKYNHPMYSFRDHSIFLTSRSRYAFLFDYQSDDYKKWAYGLRQAGYATDRKYPQKLIDLIKRYNLDKYDEKVVLQPKQYEVFTHVVKKGETLYAISRRYAISVDELKQINNLNNNSISIGQVLNIRREKSK